MKFRLKRTHAIAAALCAGTLSLASQSIIDGLLAPMGGELAPVFALEGSDNRLCTGVLVAPNLVLTAAHCVDGRMQVYSVANGTNLSRKKYRGYVSKILRMKSHPDYVENMNGGGLEIAKSARWDIGYVVLKTPITQVTPMRVRTFSTTEEVQALTGKLATTTGYGFSVFRPDGDYDPFDMGRKRYGEKTITQATLDFIAFDSPKHAVLPGDSGGPLLYDDGTGKVAIGVNHSMMRNSNTLAYQYAIIHTFRPESVCWAEKSSGIDIPSVDCP